VKPATAAVDPLESLARLLDRAVRGLADAGEPEAACRVAAKAWWIVREPSPAAARRLNATLHRLTSTSPKHAKGEPCP
jgi:hypothetical protein